MSGYLLDTNVLSELTRPAPAPQVAEFLRESKANVYLSVLSIGEIRKGISSLPPGSRRVALEAWLDAELMPWLGARLVPVTLAVAERWGRLCGQDKAAGRQRPVIDGLLAATALEHELVLATRNVRDYENSGLSVLHPWVVR